MSRLTETKRAYDMLGKLLDAEVLKRRGSAKELEKFRVSLDVAFYLLGWAQFEYLVRQEATEMIDEKARAKTIDGKAWQYIKENVKNIPVRHRLDMVFHGDQPRAINCTRITPFAARRRMTTRCQKRPGTFQTGSKFWRR